MYQTTINGQLFLLMLIEDLELAGFKVYSANTDGVVAKVHIGREEEYKAICTAWEEETGFTLSYTNYAKYVRLGVNSYMALKDDGKVKTKNDFTEDLGLSKGYFAPVIARAINNYFLFDKDIDETLKEETNIYDFCISQKTGKQFYNIYQYIKDGQIVRERLQKNIRYYVTTDSSSIVKQYKETEGKNANRIISLVAKYNTKLFNDFVRKDSILDYHINYNYYKMLCYEKIHLISGVVYNKMRKETGKLFDDI